MESNKITQTKLKLTSPPLSDCSIFGPTLPDNMHSKASPTLFAVLFFNGQTYPFLDN
jgi:hypothetical protein